MESNKFDNSLFGCRLYSNNNNAMNILLRKLKILNYVKKSNKNMKYKKF